MNGQNDEVKNEAGNCGLGCNCGSSRAGKTAKWVICGVVAVAAIGVTLARVAGTKEAEKPSQGFALPATSMANTPTIAAGTNETAWAAPLKEMAALNTVATDTDAVFIVIPSTNEVRTAAIQQEVSAACATIVGRGTKTGKYLLSKDASDYKEVAGQIGAPAVLAMVKGRGMSVVADKDVTKDALLKAFVTASRPRQSCGPSGCGPSSSGCN